MKSVKTFITLLALIATCGETTAQTGEQLFKSKCNTCHLVDKNSTGPNLQGVKQKWADAGESEFLYEWVQNPGKLYASGKSTMAAAIKEFSKTDMTPQDVTNEQVDAILDYVDNYTPPATTVEGPGNEVVEYVPDYEANLELFYYLVASITIMLIIIIGMSYSIRTLVNSDFFKEKLQEKENNNSGVATAIIVLIGFTLFNFNTSYALEFMQPGEAGEGMPWLLVETSDLYYLVAINLVLLGVIFYMRRLFNEFITMVKDEKQLQSEAETVDVMKRVNTVLTDAVPIEEEHTILLHHEYDGIRELDNNLPPWWVWGFYITIGFAVVYLFNYHVLGISDLQAEEYNKSVKQAEIEVQAYLDKMAMNVDETSATLMTDASDLSAGKALFEKNCTTCHKMDGSGDIGPNLTDKYWIYGYDVKDIFKTVKYGTPNGMPLHSDKLNPIQTQQVSSYVLHLPEIKTEKIDGEIIEE
ncbi:MAG: cbb3-type cytochrome c oxidase N-terminal domain-containing protein [Crocinitomicaceae bacterium]